MFTTHYPARWGFIKPGALSSVLLLAIGCSSGGSDSNLLSSDAFDLTTTVPGTITVTEGDESSVSVPLSLTRADGSSAPVSLSIRGTTANDTHQLNAAFSAQTFEASNSSSNLVLSVGIDALPIQEHSRTITVSATDGTSTDELNLELRVKPTSKPDIYLLVGQSNMVGFSGDGTKQANAGEPDEPHPRIKQLHVSYNDEWNNFTDAAAFRSVQANVLSPAIITAEDPLHEPQNSQTQSKDNNYIGMGLSFAKAALNDTTANIVLVPAAWSGSAFCNNDNGPRGQWNADATNDPSLGNTWLFDRAITRANAAIDQSGGVLRGILWHQGESDSNSNCAGSYLANIERLAQQFRLRIKPDARGGEFRRADSPIPFILGTMSRGFDERGDLSVFHPDKQLVDNFHRELPAQLPYVATSVHDDLVGNQWPCGNSTCIHFGAEALREIGARYYQQLQAVMENNRL